MYYNNGDFYKKELKNGLKHGIGKMEYKNDSIIISFNDQQNNDLITGNGEMKYKNGDKYNDIFLNEKKWERGYIL